MSFTLCVCLCVVLVVFLTFITNVRAMSHVLQNLLILQVHVLLFFYLFGLLLHNDDLFQSFGFHDSKPVFVGLTLFNYVYQPVEHVFSFLMHLLSRRNEYQADKFAVDLDQGEKLKEALIAIHKENLSNMVPDPWYSAYHYTHPTLVERLAAIDVAQKKSE